VILLAYLFATEKTCRTVGRSTGAPSEATIFIEASLPATLTKQISTPAVSLLETVNINPVLAINSFTSIRTVNPFPSITLFNFYGAWMTIIGPL